MALKAKNSIEKNVNRLKDKYEVVLEKER